MPGQAGVTNRHELPFEFDEEDGLFKDPAFSPRAFFIAEVAARLQGGLQPGDLELFLGEQWVTTEAYSPGLFTSQYLEDNPEEKVKSDEFLLSQGIDRVSALIGYIERAYGGDEDSDREKWSHIFRDYPRLSNLMTHLIPHESIEDSVTRILKIKQKLQRMPDLDTERDEETGELMIDDCLPGYFHPRDAALLGILGLLIGLVVTRSSDSGTLTLLDEDLIKYAEAEDFWFHVDDLSSAHVYLKPQAGWTLDTIPEDVLIDCAQLVKANSIEGNKKNDIKVVYTPAKNLRKEASFDVGQVAFHIPKQLRYIKVEKRINDIVNRLNKTKEEKTIDFEAEKAARLAMEKRQRKQEAEKRKAEEEKERKAKQAEMDMKSYASVFKHSSSAMSTNKETKVTNPRDYEENFF